ncbi:MAG: site-specific integrase [Proteobacteria bacterium]|nr:site-specific integrase [Pseudomonadota bacterium]
MAALKRIKTNYPGVFYINGTSVVSGKEERIYYIRYRKNNKLIEEKAGRQFQDDMTPARASIVRAQRMNGDTLSNQEKRAKIEARKKAELNRWTIERLWDEYASQRTQNENYRKDYTRYNKNILPVFGSQEPKELSPLDIDRYRVKMLKTKSPQTVKHVLSLLRRIINFGVKKGLCPPPTFFIEMPKVDNLKDDALTEAQITKLLKAADEDDHPHAGAIIKMALLTGMRRGELFKLQWSDIDFEKKFIRIRDPKGGKGQSIPLNKLTEELLLSHRRTKSPFVFPGRNGKQRTNAQKSINNIKEKAGLPKEIRPLHSLRHTFATMLANSGEVDMYTLQKLTTHKGPQMLQRYAHLRDAKLHEASSVAGNIIENLEFPGLNPEEAE